MEEATRALLATLKTTSAGSYAVKDAHGVVHQIDAVASMVGSLAMELGISSMRMVPGGGVGGGAYAVGGGGGGGMELGSGSGSGSGSASGVF